MCPDSTTKRCTACDTIKPLGEFNKNRTRRDGLSSQCRECARSYGRLWRAANPDAYADAIRQSKAKNPEKYRAHVQAWEQAHPEKVREAKQRYVDTHPYGEERREYFRKRYQQNGAQMRAQHRQYQKSHRAASALKTRRYRARKGHKRIHGWPALRAWFGNCCLCCGAARRIEADHVVPLSKGGSDDISNIQPLCRSCNAGKATQATDYRDPDRLAAFLASFRK